MAVHSNARIFEGYALALLGAIAGGIAGGFLSVWSLERRPGRTGAIDGIAEGLADLGMVVVFALVGACLGCYALLRLRRHPYAGRTALALAVLTLTTFWILPLIPGDTFLVVGLWLWFVLFTPLVARAVVGRVLRDD